MRPALALRWMVRESRGAWGRMAYFTVCLAVGVAAVVGTAAVSQSVEEGFRSQSREMMGADLVADARRPLPDGLGAVFARHAGLEWTDVVETPSMAMVPGDDGRTRQSKLVQILAVKGRYPLAGELTTNPPGGLSAHLAPGTVVVSRDALDALGVRPGDDIVLGRMKFRVAAEVVRAPPQFGFAALIGPRVYVSSEAFALTGLSGFGTRARHAAMVVMPEGSPLSAMDALAAEIRTLPGAEYLDVTTHLEFGPNGGSTTRRLTGFLGLVALLSMAVGGIGVAQIVRVWLVGRTQAIAVMRCLGVRPVEILVISLGHTALLALLGSVLGAALGCALPSVVNAIAPDLVPGGLPAILPVWPVIRGLVMGGGIALIFSLPPLTAVWRVPPALVLRADAAPLPMPRGVAVMAATVLIAGVLGAAWLQAGQLDWALWFTGGFAALVGVLYAASRALRLAAKVPRLGLPPYLRHGVAALARPGAGTSGSVVALGLGAMVIVAMALVQTQLRAGLLAQVPTDAPSMFFIDVQPDQWPGVESALTAAGARHVDHVPVVTARIATIDGRPVEELADEATGAGVSRRALTREQRLTTQTVLPPSNRIVAGALWSDPARQEVSIEERFAQDLCVGVGTVIGFDVQGVPLELVVTSLRAVEWQSFSINFFLVVEPGVLDRAPALLLASARLPVEAEQRLQNRVAQNWPNVSVLRVGPILEEVSAVLRRVVGGIAALGSFTVAAGLLVLAGAASAAALRRRREVALLKTLGVTRAGVCVLLAVEYGLVGAVAGFIGSAGALALSWSFLHYVAELAVDVPYAAIPLTTVLCGVAAAACGLAASVRALRARPIETLR